MKTNKGETKEQKGNLYSITWTFHLNNTRIQIIFGETSFWIKFYGL